MNKQRIIWFDILKLFAMFLVVWGHCIQRFIAEDASDIEIYRFIYSFHMPLFMCISGFFASNLINTDYRTTVYKKLRQLILPAITFSVLAAFFTVVKGIANDFIYEFKTSFWFLKSAFICCLLYVSIYKIFQFIGLKFNIINDLIILLLCSITVSHVGLLAIDRMFPSFLLGTIIHRNFDKFRRYDLAIFIISSFLFLAFHILSYHICKLPQQSYIYIFSILITGLLGSITFISGFSFSSKRFDIQHISNRGGGLLTLEQ